MGYSKKESAVFREEKGLKDWKPVKAEVKI